MRATGPLAASCCEKASIRPTAFSATTGWKLSSAAMRDTNLFIRAFICVTRRLAGRPSRCSHTTIHLHEKRGEEAAQNASINFPDRPAKQPEVAMMFDLSVGASWTAAYARSCRLSKSPLMSAAETPSPTLGIVRPFRVARTGSPGARQEFVQSVDLP